MEFEIFILSYFFHDLFPFAHKSNHANGEWGMRVDILLQIKLSRHFQSTFFPGPTVCGAKR